MQKRSSAMRKLLYAVHISFSGILLGCTVAFVVIDIAALATADPRMLEACYRIMHLLSHTSLRASAIGSIVSGILISVLTPWGLLKFRWIVAKEALSLLIIVLGLFGIYAWSLRGLNRVAAGGAIGSDAQYQANSLMLSVGIALQLLSLLALYLLSVYKPWGPVRKSKKNRNYPKN